MPIEMRNLTTFPIERLCFDLKLVLGQLDAKDVMELVKVNQGFQWMISNRPSIVFGHHVNEIEFGFDPDRSDYPHEIPAININKPVSFWVSLDVIRHFPFIKNIRSCDKLSMDADYKRPIDKDQAAFLKQLEVVNSLDLSWCPPEHLELLSHLSMKIKRYARLPSFLKEAPSLKDLVGHFIEAQLNECERVEFDCEDDDEFQFYYNALIKTHVKCVGISCGHGDLIVPAIQRIVSHGIPSKNPAAVVRIYHSLAYRRYEKTTVVGFLKGYPGMTKISREDRRPFIALANDHWKGSRRYAFTMESPCFRRNINATRDCIYMLSARKIDTESCIIFFAFYIKPDEMIDH